jgi:hypothetical protein
MPVSVPSLWPSNARSKAARLDRELLDLEGLRGLEGRHQDAVRASVDRFRRSAGT